MREQSNGIGARLHGNQDSDALHVGQGAQTACRCQAPFTLLLLRLGRAPRYYRPQRSGWETRLSARSPACLPLIDVGVCCLLTRTTLPAPCEPSSWVHNACAESCVRGASRAWATLGFRNEGCCLLSRGTGLGLARGASATLRRCDLSPRSPGDTARRSVLTRLNLADPFNTMRATTGTGGGPSKIRSRCCGRLAGGELEGLIVGDSYEAVPAELVRLCLPFLAYAALPTEHTVAVLRVTVCILPGCVVQTGIKHIVAPRAEVRPMAVAGRRSAPPRTPTKIYCAGCGYGSCNMRRARTPGWPYPALRTLNLCPATPLVDANGDAIDEAHVDFAALYALASSSFHSSDSSFNLPLPSIARCAASTYPSLPTPRSPGVLRLRQHASRSLLPLILPALNLAIHPPAAGEHGRRDCCAQYGAVLL